MSTSTIYQSPQHLHSRVKESILQINNEGVLLLQAGNCKVAMIRLARCLAIMTTTDIEGEKEVHFQFTRPPQMNSLPGNSTKSSPRYLFAAPSIVTPHKSHSSTSFSSNDGDQSICKLLSIVLFNLSLAHHLQALQLMETTQYKVQHEFNRSEEVRDSLEKSLRLYRLCHSSLVFTNSGLLCSDLSIAVVVTNNVGEIYKELYQQRGQNDQQENCRAAMTCSEQLIQIFMFFAANGGSNRLEGFGDILSNAMATLNGPQNVAPAA